jgi:hypothetical protein
VPNAPFADREIDAGREQADAEQDGYSPLHDFPRSLLIQQMVYNVYCSRAKLWNGKLILGNLAAMQQTDGARALEPPPCPEVRHDPD